MERAVGKKDVPGMCAARQQKATWKANRRAKQWGGGGVKQSQSRTAVPGRGWCECAAPL